MENEKVKELTFTCLNFTFLNKIKYSKNKRISFKTFKS